jgi:hypothetical protein
MRSENTHMVRRKVSRTRRSAHSTQALYDEAKKDGWFQGLVSELVEGADVIKRGIIEIAAAALFLPFSVIGSHVADLPTAVPYVAPVVPPQPVYSWTGIYHGVNGGYGFGQFYAYEPLFERFFGPSTIMPMDGLAV